jgi:gliding motility-associated-like protein
MRFWLTFLFFISLFGTSLNAQYCTAPTSITPITPTTTTQFTATFPAGTAPVFTFTATAGCTYTFATCGLSNVDTYLRIYNAASGLVQGWDDGCGGGFCNGGCQTPASWVCPTTGLYSLQLSEFFCSPLTGPSSVSYFTSCPATSCTNPIVNAGNDLVLCAGGTTQLAGLASVGSGSGSTLPLTFSWTPATGLSATNILNPIASPTTTTTYTLTASQGSCTSQDQVVVTVNPTPTISGTAQSFCPGSSVTLTANGTPSGGTFLWTPGGSTSSSITVSPSLSTSYNVQYTVSGCSASSTLNATQINSIDWANIQQPGNSSICEGQSLTIFGQVYEQGLTISAGQAAGISVQYGISTVNTNPSTWPSSAWSSATYNPQSLVNPNNDEYQATLNNLTPGTYYYSFSYTYNGCTVYGGYSTTGGGFWNGTSNLNGVLVVNSNVLPNFSITPAICIGSTFPVLPTSSIGGIQGSWAPAPNNLQTTTYTFTPTIGQCALTTTSTVTVNALPLVSISNASNTNLLNCTQTSISLNAIGMGSYTWANGVVPISTGSSIAVTSPGIYTLNILDSNGCVNSTNLTIIQDITIPTPSISTSPNTQILTCSTPSITLNGTGGNSYTWSNGSTSIGNTATISITIPGTYTVTATGPNGCIDTEIISISQNITPPVAAIQNMTNTNILDCNTTSISLMASGGISYSWSNGAAIVGATPQLQVTTPGTYTLTATGPNGCIDIESITITSQANTNPTFTQINPICTGASINLPAISNNGIIGTWNPAPNLNSTTTYTFTPNTGLCANISNMTIVVNPFPTITALNDTICAGNTGTITTQVSIPGGIYNWSPIVNNQANLSQILNMTSTFQVIYSVLGCADTASASIIVKPVPQVLTQNDTICSGEVATIEAFVDLPNGTYSWSNGNTASLQSLSPAVTTNYIVVYTVNNCSSIPATATITVLPVPSITINNQTICAGDLVTIQANANPAGTYYWGPNGIQGISTNSFTPQQDTTIQVYNILNGCSSDTVQATVAVLPLPISSFGADILQGCVPLNVNFSADVIDNNATYNWQTSNQLNTIGAQANLAFITNGSFSVTLTATLNGCSSNTTISNMIAVDNYPIASFEPSSQVFTEPNQTLSFWNSSVGSQTYTWNFGDGGTSNEEGPTHHFNVEKEGSTIVLYAYSTLGCMDSTSLFIGFDPGLVYYIPNSFTPDGDQFNQTFLPIFTSGIDPFNYQLLIYNSWGEVLFESRDPSIGWDGSYGEQGAPCQIGTYTYLLTIKIPTLDKRQTISGHVNLIR